MQLAAADWEIIVNKTAVCRVLKIGERIFYVSNLCPPLISVTVGRDIHTRVEKSVSTTLGPKFGSKDITMKIYRHLDFSIVWI